MTTKEGVVILDDEKEEERGGDPFDIFSVPTINTDYDKAYCEYIEPMSHITQTGPIVFKWQTEGGERWDSSTVEVETTFNIMKTSGSRATDTDDISFINSLPACYWDKIELKANDKILTNSSCGNHAYHAYLMQKSSYGKDVKKEILKRTEGYIEDDPDKVDQFELKTATVDGQTVNVKDPFRERHDFFLNQPTVNVITRSQLYLDLTQVLQYHPTDIDYSLTLTRNPESFCLISDATNDGLYKIVIKRIRLIIRKIKPSAHMIAKENHFINVKRKKAYIPYTHTMLTDRLLPANSNVITFRDVCGTMSSLPKKLFVFFVDHTAFAGR